jgi:hypothetical protein
MAPPPTPTHGRTATLFVSAILLLTVAGTVYVFLAQNARPPLPAGAVISDEDVDQLAYEAHQLITLLTILLTSALLILLFFIGAYLVIRVGQFVARDRVGGRPTPYVDAWSAYRLTDDDIAAATGEDKKKDTDSDPGPDAGGERPPDPPPEPPPARS